MVRNHTPGKIFVAGVYTNCFYVKKSGAVIITVGPFGGFVWPLGDA